MDLTQKKAEVLKAWKDWLNKELNAMPRGTRARMSRELGINRQYLSAFVLRGSTFPEPDLAKKIEDWVKKNKNL